jgi:hypothetical protein
MVVSLAIGLGLLMGAIAALYFSTQNDLLTSYKAAPYCPALADAAAGKDCRYSAAATVTQLAGDGGGTSVYFSVLGPYTPLFEARLPPDIQTDALVPGSQVQVELWRLRVTKFNGANTADNPANDPRPGTLLVIGLLVLPLGLGATGWGIVAAGRRARAAHGQETATPSMSPVAFSDVFWR